MKQPFLLTAPLPKEAIGATLKALFHDLTLAATAIYAQLPRSTLHDLLGSDRKVVGLFRMLEQMLPAERQAFVESFCRHRAKLRHPAIEHDGMAVIQLENVAMKITGLTLVRSENLVERLFVAHALASHLQNSAPQRRILDGIWCVGSDLFAPVLSMILAQRQRGAKGIAEAWLLVTESVGRTLFLAEGLGDAPELIESVQKESRSRHVVVCDKASVLEQLLEAPGANTHLVDVTSLDSHTLRVQVHAL